jgi:hypothetical protein
VMSVVQRRHTACADYFKRWYLGTLIPSRVDP